MQKNSIHLLLLSCFLCLSCSELPSQSQASRSNSPSSSKLFLNLLDETDDYQKQEILTQLSDQWQASDAILALESIYLSRKPMTSLEILKLLEQKTGKNFAYDFDRWYEWLWNKEEMIGAEYGDFKANLYKRIDPRFETYFKGRQNSARIRLDEVRWGGVKQDGIPPLRSPKMISAQDANYLEDDNIVFGIEVNGDVRVYPKRILAWHEMFVDEVGGVPVAGVYCTLCGTVILYKTEQKGVQFELGTSGFLYRSNKLMYDRETQSLWNTLQGSPVLGPLANQGIELEFMSVVTTTWGVWKKRHPQTQVLSLDTGHRRDYGEGVAYKKYFATDELMFNTPFKDNRLNNKQEILALRFLDVPNAQLAISTRFLNKNPLYVDKVGSQSILVLTDKSGANRVYDPKEVTFKKYDQGSELIDSTGKKWTLSEHELRSEEGEILHSLPYHRAFWFGWLAAFPDTRLVK